MQGAIIKGLPQPGNGEKPYFGAHLLAGVQAKFPANERSGGNLV
jgi:hypothetical protein